MRTRRGIIGCGLFLAWLLLGAPALADDRPVVAVFLGESHGSPLAADEVSSLTDYLSTRLGESGGLLVLHRSEMRTRLGPAAAREFDGCREPVCRHRLAGKVGAAYALASWIGRLGSSCLLAVDVMDIASQRLVSSVHGRCACSADALVEGFERLATALPAGLARGAAGRRPLRVVVQALESRGSPLSADDVVLLGRYLRSRLLASGRLEVLPGEALRRKAGDEIPAQAADVSLQVTISRAGAQCLLVASAWDLSAGKQVRAVTGREPCEVDRLLVGLERLADKLAVALPPAPAP